MSDGSNLSAPKWDDLVAPDAAKKITRPGSAAAPAAAPAPAPAASNAMPSWDSLEEPSAATAAAPVITKPTAPPGDFMRGLKTAAHQLPQLAGGSAAFAGDVLERGGKALGGDGATGEALKDYGLGVYKDHEDDTQQLSKDSDSFTHVLQHPGEAGSFLKYNAGYMGGQMLESAAAMGAGALLGSEAPGVGNVVGAGVGLVARPALEKAILKKTVELMAEKGLAKEAAEQAAKVAVKKKLGAEAGAAVAGGALNYGQELGSIYPEALDQADSEHRELTGGDLAKVGGGAAAAAAVDTLGDRLNLGAVLKGVKKPAEQAGEAAVKSALRQRAEATAKAMGEQALIGGGTEAVQTAIERGSAGQSLTDRDALVDIVDSTAAGAVGGGMAGAGAGLHTQKAQQATPVQAPEQTAPPVPAPQPTPTITNPNIITPDDGPLTRGVKTAGLAGAADGVEPTVDAGAAAAPADEQPPPTDAQPPTAAPAPAAAVIPPAPWANPETGEVLAPNKSELTRAVAAHVLDTYMQSGHMRIDPQVLGDAWGVTKTDINKVRRDANEIARQQVASAERTAMGEPQGTLLPDAQARTAATESPSAERSAPTPAPTSEPTSASVPFMITQATKAQLRTAGKTDADIAKMTPEQAHAFLKDNPDGGADDQKHAGTDNGTQSATPTAAGDQGAGATDAPVPAQRDAGSAEASADKAGSRVPADDAGDRPAAVANDPVASDAPAALPADTEAQTPTITETSTSGASSAGGGSASSGSATTGTTAAPAPAATESVAPTVAGSTDAVDAPKWFGTQAKAGKYVERKGLQGTHEVINTGKRFEVQPKAAAVPAAATPSEASAPAVAKPPTHGATRDAEGFRVKTDAGEITGRAHVDQLVGKGYTKVKSTRAGDKMVHTLVNAAGESEPIKARQLPYAKQLTEHQASQASAAIETAAHQAATSPQNDRAEPTQGQIEAGNYAKGHVRVHGLDISVENPRGSVRSGTDAGGKPWSHTMSDHYGYIRGTIGADKEHIDTYVGPHHDAPVAYVVDQIHQGTGKFDEHKIMLGFREQGVAVRAYRSNFDAGWKVGQVHAVPVDELKAWLAKGDTTKAMGERAAAPVATDRREATSQRAAIDALPPAQSEVEKLRARVADLERESRTSAVTGLRNKAAFDEDAALGWPNVGAADMDGLKALNDSIGHEAADTVLKALGEFMRGRENEGARFYHRSGDEFAARFKDPAEGVRSMRDLQEALEATKVELNDGVRTLVYDGIGLSVGQGATYEAADNAVNRDKAARLASGKRQPPRDAGRPARLRDVTAGVQAQAGDTERAAVQEAGDGQAVSAAPVSEKAAEKAPPSNDRFSGNTIFTADKVAAARARLKAKLGTLNAGVDPEVLLDGLTIAGAYIESGARTFSAYSKAMVSDLGDAIKPFLLSFYESVRHYPGFDAEGMTPADQAKRAHGKMMDKVAAPAVVKPAAAAQTAPEGTATSTEKASDTADQTDAPALDKPLAEGLKPAGVRADQPVRGAAVPRGGDRRADDGNVRRSGEPAGEQDHRRGQVGNDRGRGLVPDAAHGAVAANRGGPAAADYRARPDDLTRTGSWHDTAARNVDLIELARKIDADGRPATPAEQAQLAKYTGFGAGEIRNNLFPVPSAHVRAQNPGRLIFSDMAEGRWKPLAARLEALPKEWQQSVLQSTQYAHYTSPAIVQGMWKALQNMGFTGGRILEPGAGIGNFPMLMPEDVRLSSRYTGIEFDGPTALIAKLLSPQQDVMQGDFIKRRLPADYFDVAVGNPPFSATKIQADPDYAKNGFMLHDFFFAKSLDRIRPGGLLAFVTSKGTMDKQSAKARRFMADRADLLGAVRLPSTAFEGNAGTSVVTDVIFMRKRLPGEDPAGHTWTNLKTVETKDGPTAINEYFADNPAMVLGQNRISGNVDDHGRSINSNGRGGEKYTVVSYDQNPGELEAKFAKALESLPTNAYSVLSKNAAQTRAETAKVDFNPATRREGVIYSGADGELMIVRDGAGIPLDSTMKLSAKDKAWFSSYVGLRDLLQEARLSQVSDGDWKKSLAKLNKAYDAFRKEHGPLLDYRKLTRKSTDEDGNPVESTIRIFKNKRLYREDYDNSAVTMLEHINEAGDIVKGKFLLDRTVGAPVQRDVKTIGDALAVSLDETGSLDLADVAQRLGISEAEATDALGAQVFQSPAGEWQLSDAYLSGDVVRKLAEAQEASRTNPAMERNIEALKQVQPEKLGPSQISVRLGASWVPDTYVNEFASEIGANEVSFDPTTETWQVDGANLRRERSAGEEYGTADRSPSELLEAALNSRTVTIKKTDADKKTYTDKVATTAANEAMKKIRDKFKSWVWTDGERAGDLVERYNTQFNNIAGRRFDGSHLTLPGVSLRYTLHPHQLRAIWRQVQTGSTYLAHAVGSGKTIEMIAGGMEQKRLGLIKKPMYVVPNHMLEQFSNEFMELYPLANIMVADDENFHADRRKAFVAAATMNAPDAIVITHSAFERIGVKEESVAPIRDELIEALEDHLKDTGTDDRVRRSQLQQQIESVTQRFDKILGGSKKDNTFNFEDIGADFLYVDEAHAYRKLDFSTEQKIKGIDPVGSKRALDMFVKTRHLESQRPGRSMVFASGTPVTNTMGELYTVMRFFADQQLQRDGTATFDSWSRQFGEARSDLEANAVGRYETVERFAKFTNVPELMSRVRQFMDVLTSDHLGATVKRPDVEGGKPDLVLVEPTNELKHYMEGVLAPRLERSRAWKPSPDEPFNPDPVIAITSDGRFAALDPRFIGARIDEDKTPTKLTAMADNIAADYKAGANNVYTDDTGNPEAAKGDTHIVFYNLGFGKQSAENRGFSARDALTRRLVSQGVKRKHIAWFDDANTDAKKEAIFKDMRSGKLRVLIGSAKKMGTGVNVQRRLKTLHYFDPPWFPSDVEQPHGRIIRQGNQNGTVKIKWYATKGTYDSTMWQMVGRKQRFIDQAFSGDKSIRNMEDMSEASAYEMAAAMASGDPRALQLAGLRQDVDRFERLQAAHASQQVKVYDELRSSTMARTRTEKRIATLDAAQKAAGAGYVTLKSADVDGSTYNKPGEFGQAVKNAFNRIVAKDSAKKEHTIGSVNGHPIEMHLLQGFANGFNSYELVVRVGDYAADVVSSGAMGEQVDATGLGRRIVNRLNGIDQELTRSRKEKAELEHNITRLTKKRGAPFEYQQDLVEKTKALNELEGELKAEGEADAARNKAAQEADQTVVLEDGSVGAGEPGAFSFAGQASQTADRGALDRAQQMETMGRDAVPDREGNQPGGPDEQHMQTGWHRGADGKWRYEIDDRTAKLNPVEDAGPIGRKLSDATAVRKRAEQSGNASLARQIGSHVRDLNQRYEAARAMPLGQLLDHPALFDAYPDLAGLTVQMSDKLASFGSYDSKNSRILMRTPSRYEAKGDKSMRSVLMHEIQHAIQEREGFARGGNLADAKTLPEFQMLLQRETAKGVSDAEYRASMLTYARLAGEVEARNTQTRLNMDAEHRSEVPPEDTADVPRARQIVRFNAMPAALEAETNTGADHIAAVSKMVRAATQSWKGADLPVVKVVGNPDQLPAKARENPEHQRASGYYDGSTVYIVASAHTADAAGRAVINSTLAHEAVGHYGVDRIIERELGNGAWNKTAASIDRLRNDRTKGSADMRSVLDDVERRYAAADGTRADRETFAREALAVMAERGVRNGIIDRVVSALRKFLRRILPGLNVSDRELRQMLVASGAYLRQGGEDSRAAGERSGLQLPRDARQPQGYNNTVSDFSRDGWGAGFPPAELAQPINFLRNKPDYAAAKAGDASAALRLARDAVTPDFVNRVRAAIPKGEKPIVVPVLARESSGNNKIPAMAAKVLAQKLGTVADDGIYQADKVSRGGSDAMHRLANQPAFTGTVKPGQAYVLLDDTLTQGGTLAQLKTHIEQNGGRVVLATALTGKDYSRTLALDSKVLGQVRERFGRIEGWWKRHFGYDYSGLTASEARTLLTFDKGRLSPDQLRTGILARRLSVIDGVGGPTVGNRSNAAASGSVTQGDEQNATGGLQLPGDGSARRSDDSNSSGDFSLQEPAFKDPRASVQAIGPGVEASQETLLAKAREWLRGKGEDLVPAALGAVQRRFLTELMEDHPALKGAKRYDNQVQQLDADRAQLLAGAIDAAEHPGNMLKKGAGDISKELQAFTFETGPGGWLGRKKPVAKLLAHVMHESTIEGMDPSEAYQRLKMKDSRGEWVDWTPALVKERIAAIRDQMRGRAGDDKRAMMDEIKTLRTLKFREQAREKKFPELVARYQSLPAEGQSLYKQMRDWHAQMSDATLDALQDRVQALRKDMKQAGNDEFAERFTRQLVQKLRAEFEANKVQGVYFPLTRDGDFWVSYKDAKGGQGFQMFESTKAATTFVKELKSKGGSVEAQGRRTDIGSAKDAPSGTFIADIISTLKKSGAPEKVQDEIYQTFLRTLPEMSMRKHAIHRKATPGFSDDITRGFAKNAFHGAHQLSRLRYAHRMQTELDTLQSRMDSYRRMPEVEPAKVARGDAMLGELKKRHDYIMSPTESQLANTLNGIGFMYYLGASPASALVNLTQNAQVTLPVLGAHHGWPSAMRELGAAVRDSMRTGGNIDRTLKKPDEIRAYRAMAARGDIDKTQAHTMAGLAEGNMLKANPTWAKVMGGLTWMFHKAEVVNREAAGMAAYRLSRAKGEDFNTAVQYASDIINGTHFDYSAANRPRYMQGNAARVALQFKNYSVSMTQLLYRNLYQTFKGESPEVRRVARRTLTGLLGMTGLLAGAVGLPIINVIRYAAQGAHLIGGDDDEPWDFDTEFRNWLAEHLGPDVAKWVAGGAVNQLTGFDIGSRVSMSDMWFRDADRQLEGRDAYYNMLDAIVGPLGGMVKNFYVGAQRISEGNTMRGIETMLPTFAKNAMKGTRYAAQGVNTLHGAPIVDDISSAQAFSQMIGLRPTEIAEQYRINNAVYTATQFVQDRRHGLMNAYAMALNASDGEGIRSVLTKIQAFNGKWPQYPISAAGLRASMQGRARSVAQSKNGLRVNKRIDAQIRQMVQPAGE